MVKYNRVFVPNPSLKFDTSPLDDLAESIVYVCDMPMFDNLTEDDNIGMFEKKISRKMEDFNPVNDVVGHYGDGLIFAMMVMFLSDQFDSFDIARFSHKKNGYVVRNLSYDKF